MIGEYGSRSDLIKSLLPAVFSYLAACFVSEDIDTKLQILNCIPKVKCLFVVCIALKEMVLCLLNGYPILI
jgi:hypothetical protein